MTSEPEEQREADPQSAAPEPPPERIVRDLFPLLSRPELYAKALKPLADLLGRRPSATETPRPDARPASSEHRSDPPSRP